MTNEIKISVDTTKKKHSMEDLFGIFFEDLNHAADGGLYAEMIRNRSFEFCEIDNKDYTHLTAWKIEGLEEGQGNGIYRIESEVPVSDKNPHYLTMNIIKDTEDVAIVNQGFNGGLYLEEGKIYNFSAFFRTYGYEMKLLVSLADEDDTTIDSKVIEADGDGWKKYKLTFKPSKTTLKGKLKISPLYAGRVSMDHISLFPEDTFMKRENGLRRDLAEMLKELKPKFLRFPGGCLVHSGSLNANDRDSMYRWKNTLGDVTERPARKNNWGYNQTMGLGYYEYFCLCEDIGAKPLPVVPGGVNPHKQDAVPLNEIEIWTNEAEDVIEFANGSVNTKWGKVRAELGHPEPFNLEYIAIGNEEVGKEFFERYPYFQKAINKRFPEIKVIGTASPFQAGMEFERGWKSAIENKADLVDEHYYMAPEWFIANMDRYLGYKEENPKVFLGEYASWGNTYYNALVEAAYMTRMQEAAHAVGLACYAPLFANVDYVNWKPDMIWFNSHDVYGTPNYYVQKMFMHHQGDNLLETKISGMGEKKTILPLDLTGDIVLEGRGCEVLYSDIKVTNDITGEVYEFGDKHLTVEDNKCKLMSINAEMYTIKMKAKQVKGTWGFLVNFGLKDNDNKYFWELGGWQNLDAAICHITNGRNSCLTQREVIIDAKHTYDLEISVKANGEVKCYLDGELFQETLAYPVEIEDLYVTSAVENETGDIIVKAVNLDNESKTSKIKLEGMPDGSYDIIIEDMKDIELDWENDFENKTKVCSKINEMKVSTNEFEYTFPKYSITILRIKGNK